MTPAEKADIEALREAIKHINERELPQRPKLTTDQQALLMDGVEVVAMFRALKKFGVPAFNLAVTIAGLWWAAEKFFGGSGK